MRQPKLRAGQAQGAPRRVQLQPQRAPNGKRRQLQVEALEARNLMAVLAGADAVAADTVATDTTAADAIMVPHYQEINASAGTISPLATSGPTGLTPAQMRHAYGFDAITFGSGTVAGDGAGTTIAIVDAYDDPNIANDLHQFDLKFGLPDPVFTKVNQNGGSQAPAANGGWASEIALDVEWAHAIAPKANILLVEANDSSLSNLLTAVNYARNAPGVVAVSMSWGGGEFSGEQNYDSYFTTPTGHTGVSFFVAAGDSGAPAEYPSASPNVVSVGGTSLTLSGGNYSSESAWSGSGGGVSLVESQPTYQKGIVTQSTTLRSTPDVSFDANPNTGVAVYDSYNNGSSAPWSQFGGTSIAAPQWAALTAIVDQGRILAGKTALDGRTQLLPALYQLSSADFHDVTTGSSTGSPRLSATAGYDLVTGRGTPIANLVVNDLVGQTSSTPVAATHLSVSTPSSATVGSTFSVTVSALSAANSTVAGYTGAVHFSSSDTLAGLPSDYTFTAADGGVHTFTGVNLSTTGSQSLVVADKGNTAISGSATVTVSAPAASHLSFSAPVSATAGSTFSVTVAALDASNKSTTAYTGTVHFTSTDTAAVLPADYTFTAADHGVHTFSGLALKTAGTRTIVATDKSNSGVAGAANVAVTAAAANHLLFVQQPTSAAVGASITPAVTVGVLDAFNNLLTGDNSDVVTLSLGTNTAGGVLSGTTSATVSGGLAKFSNLSIAQAGSGYTLVAHLGTLVQLTSGSFNIASAVSTSGTLEGFEGGSLSAYTVVGATTTSSSASTTAAHDGTYGLLDTAGSEWIYRSDAAAQVKRGDTVSVWVQFSGAADGRAYFGFGSSSAGTLSLVAAPNTGQLLLQSNSAYASYADLASATQTWQPNHWYKLEVAWGTSGTIVGRVYDSNGTTLLQTVTATNTTVAAGGIAFRGFGSNKLWDTVALTPSVNTFTTHAATATTSAAAAASGAGTGEAIALASTGLACGTLASSGAASTATGSAASVLSAFGVAITTESRPQVTAGISAAFGSLRSASALTARDSFFSTREESSLGTLSPADWDVHEALLETVAQAWLRAPRG